LVSLHPSIAPAIYSLSLHNALPIYRHTAQRWERYAPEFFLQAENNEFTRLSFRGLIGSGLRLTVQDTEDSRTYVGIGAYYVRETDRKSTRLNSSHVKISYAVFCLK